MIKNKSLSGTCTKDYEQYRNKLTHINEQAKRMYYENVISITNYNSSLMWKSTMDIFRYKQKTPSLPSTIITSNEEIKIPSEIDSVFNDYFATVAKLLAHDIPEPSKLFNCSPSLLICDVSNSFSLKPVTEKVICKT